MSWPVRAGGRARLLPHRRQPPLSPPSAEAR